MIEINFQIFTSVIILAILVESFVNIIKSLYNDIFSLYIHISDQKSSKKSNHYIIPLLKKLLARIFAITFGICLAVLTKTSIMVLLHIPITAFNENLNVTLEYIITGLLISRGSNGLYDLMEKIKNLDKEKKDNGKGTEKINDDGNNDNSAL